MDKKIDEVCLLLGSEMVPNWFAEAVRTLIEDSTIEISLIVVMKAAKSSDEIKQRNKFEQIKRQLLTPSFLNRDPIQHVLLHELENLSNTKWIETQLEPAKIGVKIPSAIVTQIDDRSDIVIANQTGILQGDILTQPEYGVISYHHGDIREYRGAAPTGFWQHLNDEKYAGITLQRLNEELDAGEIVAFNKVSIGDADTWYEVQERMYSASIPMLKEGIETLEDSNEEPIIVSDSDLGEMYYRSDWTVCVRLRSRIKDITNSLLP
jgi:folate-dependent phosphoribosylglycinamide formyltransferase PurN